MQLFIGIAQARSERKRSGAYARVDGNTVIAYWENNQRLKGLYFKPITQSTSTVSGVFLFSFDLLLVVVWTARQRIFLINFDVVVVLFTLRTICDGSLLGWVWWPFLRNHIRRVDSNWILGFEFDTEPLEVISKMNILLKFKHNLFLFALHFMKTVNYFIRPLSLLLLLFLLQWLSLPFRNILGGWQRDSRHENAVAIVLLSEENIVNCFLIQNCCIRFRCRLLIACSSGYRWMPHSEFISSKEKKNYPLIDVSQSRTLIGWFPFRFRQVKYSKNFVASSALFAWHRCVHSKLMRSSTHSIHFRMSLDLLINSENVSNYFILTERLTDLLSN